MEKNKRYQKRQEKRRILRLKDGTIVGPHEDLRHRNFSGMDLSFVDLEFSLIEGANFNDADLTGAYLSEANGGYGTSFRRAILTDADLCEINIRRANFEDAVIGGANFSHAILPWANFKGVTTESEGYRLNERTFFRYADLTNSDFRPAKIENVEFEFASLSDANMEGISLNDVDLLSVRLVNTNLKNSNISYSILAGANLEGADLSGSNIYTCDFQECTWGSPSFSANVSGANLSFCYFEREYELRDIRSMGGKVTDCVSMEFFIVAEDRVARFAYALGLDTAAMGLPDGGPETELQYISWPYDVAIKKTNLVKSVLGALELAVCDLAKSEKRNSPSETIKRAMYASPGMEDTILDMAYEAIELCIKIIDSED